MHRNRILYGFGMEFLVLASGRSGRSEKRVSAKQRNNFMWILAIDINPDDFSCGHQELMKTLQGIALAVQSFGGELPFFFISGWLVNKMGHSNAMTMVLFAFGVRLCLYSSLSDPWWVLPIELMQGVTFALFYATMATYANIVAPHGTAATLQVCRISNFRKKKQKIIYQFHLNRDWSELYSKELECRREVYLVAI